MNEQIVVAIVMVSQFLWPILIPKIGAERLKKMVPLGNLLVSLVTQLWTGFASAAQPAITPTAYMTAGFFGTFGPTLLDVLVNSLIQTFVVTGAHSAQKNVRQGAKK